MRCSPRHRARLAEARARPIVAAGAAEGRDARLDDRPGRGPVAPAGIEHHRWRTGADTDEVEPCSIARVEKPAGTGIDFIAWSSRGRGGHEKKLDRGSDGDPPPAASRRSEARRENRRGNPRTGNRPETLDHEALQLQFIPRNVGVYSPVDQRIRSFVERTGFRTLFVSLPPLRMKALHYGRTLRRARKPGSGPNVSPASL